MKSAATVSSKGQVTLPIAMRKQLGIEAGSEIAFEVRDREIVIRPSKPLAACYGLLKSANLGELKITKVREKY